MADNSALAEFKQGIKLLRNGNSAEALEYLRHAAELKQENLRFPFILGVSIARAQRKWGAAVELCEAALRLRRTEAQLYLNLAEVYVSAGRRDDAIEILDTASGVHRANAANRKNFTWNRRRVYEIRTALALSHVCILCHGKRFECSGGPRKLDWYSCSCCCH